MKLLLDLDGILVDFVGGVCRVHGRPSPFLTPENLGRYDMHECWQMSAGTFWKPLRGYSFWRNLEPTPEFECIVDLVFDFFEPADVALVTAPNLDPQSAAAKIAWVQHYLPLLERQLVITPAKHFLAHSRTLLVDDSEANVSLFEKEGGEAMLFPRPWNRLHAKAADAVEELDAHLRHVLEKRFDQRYGE